MCMLENIFSLTSSLFLFHPFVSAVSFHRNFQTFYGRQIYPVLIRSELSSRFKLYDPAIKIVLADNYIDGRNCKPLSRGALSNTLSVEAFVSPILRTICWSGYRDLILLDIYLD